MSQFFNSSSSGSFNSTVPVIIPETFPYQVESGNYYILVGAGEPVTINLPATPEIGNRYFFKDAIGVAGSNPITIDGNGNEIDDQPTYTIGSNYGFVGFLYSSLGWSVINQ